MILKIVDSVISNFQANFDISFIISVNVLTYLIIRCVDSLNGDKSVNTWCKRLIAIIASVILALLYFDCGYDNVFRLINSTIIAPVAWSWILKPIAQILKMDYKQIVKSKKL